jgi:protein-S-isoprenylcysteine O-methyltransferase Ste14
MRSLLQIFLPIYFLAYYFLFILKSYSTYKRTGINPYVFGKSESVQKHIGRYFTYMSLLTLVTIILYIAGDQAYLYSLPFSILEIPSLQITGLILLIFSLILIAIAQWSMKTSWRIGIDKDSKTQLIDKGLFRISRNPVFLGTLITVFSFFMVLPNSITLVIAAVSYVSIQIQVRFEEEYLVQTFGKDYENYCLKVRRWL